MKENKGQKEVAKQAQDKQKQKMRAGKVLDLLDKEYPDAHCALIHKNAFELLIATILSAQCTDERVNLVTPSLFAKYPNAFVMAQAPEDEIKTQIRSINFFQNKAKALKVCSTQLVEQYGGEVPAEMDKLVGLRGVGRKTANVVLGNAFGVPSVVVDTHVGRLAQRLGWTEETTPEKIEQELINLIEKTWWTQMAHLLIAHGRAVCQARKPKCESCVLAKHCPSVSFS